MLKIIRDIKVSRLLKASGPHCGECDADIGASESGAVEVVFCPTCGTRLKKATLCKICGNFVQATAVFCTGCGVEIVRDDGNGS